MTQAKARIDYKALALFRQELRKFLAFSESAAAEAELTGTQHQALLAVRGLSENGRMSVGQLAEALLLRHHSAVELIDRLCKLGLAERASDPDDGRRVLVSLTREGERKLEALSAAHARELSTIAPTLIAALRDFNDG